MTGVMIMMAVSKITVLKKTCRFVEVIYERVLTLFAVSVISLILFYNITMTSYLVKWEVTYYVKDSVWLNLLMIFLFLISLKLLKVTILYHKIDDYISDEIKLLKLKRILLWIIFGIAAIWALSTQFIPGVDEGEIQEYVYQFIKGNYEAFEPGNYMNRYPIQRGYFLFVYIVSLLFGNKNYIIFQLINAAAISLLYKQLVEIGECFGLSRWGQLFILLIGILFFPVMGYSIMVYGNMMGVALALTATKYELHFFKNYKRKDAICCGLFISLAILLKSNMNIYLIAIVIYAVVRLCKDRKKSVFYLFFFIFIGYTVQAYVPEKIESYISGYEMENPCSALSFIAMGLQDSELAPGWWNGYIVTSYEESGKNTEVQAAIALKSIKNSLNTFQENPKYAFSFFSKKISSTWANPSFQCFGTVQNGSNIKIPKWVYWVFAYKGQYIITNYLNILVILILFGALIGLVLNYKEENFLDTLVFPMIFIGGFLFHLFWETKARYALLYFVTLIPYAVLGYSILFKNISQVKVFKERRRTSSFVKQYPCFITIVSFVILVLLYSGERKKVLGQDTNEYFDYLQEQAHIDDRNYYLEIPIDSLLLSEERDDFGNKLCISENKEDDIFFQ